MMESHHCGGDAQREKGHIQSDGSHGIQEWGLAGIASNCRSIKFTHSQSTT